jgi:hypothetical protein
MAESNLVVARYKDGRLVKGSTTDFFPERPMFHMQVAGQPKTQPVKIADLKAVFFVRSLAGNKLYVGPREFRPQDPKDVAKGRRITAVFQDGEVLIGTVLNYTPGRQGFFLIPSDANDNNLRVYVVASSVKTVKLGPEAENLARIAPRPKFKPPRAA